MRSYGYLIVVVFLSLCWSTVLAQMTEEHRFTAPEWTPPERRFGDDPQISNDGNTILTLSFHYSGVAFHRSGAFTWLDNPLLPSIYADGALPTGVALSADGNTALVSAFGFEAGVVTVFRFSGSEWNEEAILSPPIVDTNPLGYKFGRRAVLSADGSIGLISGDFNAAGVVYVYYSPDNGDHSPVSTLREPVTGHSFGLEITVSADASTAAIASHPPASYDGRVYIFRRRDLEGHEWSLEATLSGGPGSNRFGESLELSDDGSTLLVGDSKYASDTGIAYVYRRRIDGGLTRWVEEARLRGTGGTRDFFGLDVALSPEGDKALVLEPYTKYIFGGRTYVFEVREGMWNTLGYLIPSDSGLGESFSVDAIDDWAVVGRPTTNAVYLYDLSGGVTATDEQPFVSRSPLSSARPNPFAEKTIVTLRLDRPQQIEAALYDVLGRRMAWSFNGIKPAGETELYVDGGNLAPGLYLFRVSGEGWSASRRLVRERR